ncbi:hypothetical protein F5888DRAFT_1371032 [Russula emetica]|nr:hypothetical protein F5888DRAFT_1371032 [Russula emetica]
MKRLGQVFSSFVLQHILPFSRPRTGESRVPLDQPETLQGGWGSTDPSGPLFSMYLNRAEAQDKKMTDRWKADADGILIFTSLFSAVVATFIGVSIQDLKPNSQDTSAFYLANIYQILADVNVTLPPALATPPQFSPTSSAIWVNSLWFLSLVMALTCALLATLLQQWARRYLWVTQPTCTPHRRSRLRSYFAEGVDKSQLPWATEALPALLHCSLLLFFVGLAVFLFNIHHTVFTVVVCADWINNCS